MSIFSDAISFAAERLEDVMDAPTFAFNGGIYRGLPGTDPAQLAMSEVGWDAKGQITLTVRTAVFGSATWPAENSCIVCNGRTFTVTKIEYPEPSQAVSVYTLSLRK